MALGPGCLAQSGGAIYYLDDFTSVCLRFHMCNMRVMIVPSSGGYLEEYMNIYMERIAWPIALILNILFKKVRVGGDEASSTFPRTSLRW